MPLSARSNGTTAHGSARRAILKNSFTSFVYFFAYLLCLPLHEPIIVHGSLLSSVGVNGFTNSTWVNWQPYIEGGGLSGRYHLEQIHLHWNKRGNGSEHTVDGRRYPAEVCTVRLFGIHFHLRRSTSYTRKMASIRLPTLLISLRLWRYSLKRARTPINH